MEIELRSTFEGWPYPVKEPVNPWKPVPGLPVPVPWHDGTLQHAGSLGSGTKLHEAGTLSYLGHLHVTR